MPDADTRRVRETAVGREVGRVVAVWRYPVKSMGVEALDAADVSWHGVSGDRRWGFVRGGMVRSGFPWLTIRERPNLWQYRPRFAEPDRPNASPTLVRTPSGDEFDIVDPALAAELAPASGPGVHVMKQDRGLFDVAPLALITTQTVAGLNALVGARAGPVLDVERFRPNLVIDAPGAGAFPEDAWVGAVLWVGGLRLRVDQRDRRCVMVNVDPATGARDPTVLRAIARERQACLGVYGTTVRPGRVAVGDVVTVDR